MKNATPILAAIFMTLLLAACSETAKPEEAKAAISTEDSLILKQHQPDTLIAIDNVEQKK